MDHLSEVPEVPTLFYSAGNSSGNARAGVPDNGSGMDILYRYLLSGVVTLSLAYICRLVLVTLLGTANCVHLEWYVQ